MSARGQTRVAAARRLPAWVLVATRELRRCGTGESRQQGEGAVFMQDWTKILRAMGTSYPDRPELDEVCRRTGLDAAQVRRAIAELARGGFVEARAAAPAALPHLTETGMVVALGLAGTDAARDTMSALERATLRVFNQRRTGRASRHARVAESRKEPTTRLRGRERAL
jgi:DNA-binding IclR family transcriptional regulator